MDVDPPIASNPTLLLETTEFVISASEDVSTWIPMLPFPSTVVLILAEEFWIKVMPF
jgi:hypothetical protein